MFCFFVTALGLARRLFTGIANYIVSVVHRIRRFNQRPYAQNLYVYVFSFLALLALAHELLQVIGDADRDGRIQNAAINHALVDSRAKLRGYPTKHEANPYRPVAKKYSASAVIADQTVAETYAAFEDDSQETARWMIGGMAVLVLLLVRNFGLFVTKRATYLFDLQGKRKPMPYKR